MTTSQAAARPGLRHWIDRNILDLGRQVRLSYLPPLMVYLAYGISGLTGIVGTFFVKGYLGLSAESLAALGFWAGLPWALKMPIGHLVDLIWRWKGLLVYFGALLLSSSLLIMIGLLSDRAAMEAIMPADEWFVFAVLLAPIGYVIQDVVADAMTVEAVPRVDDQGKEIPDAERRAGHTTMQTLGRVAIVGGGVLVSLANVILFADASELPEPEKIAKYRQIYLFALAVPVISVFGVMLAGHLQRRQIASLKGQGLSASEIRAAVHGNGERPPVNWWILGGGLLFAVVSITLGMSKIPYKQEIIFGASMLIVLFLMFRLVRELDPVSRHTLVGTALLIFVFRAMPGPGAGSTWWMIDSLGFDEGFLARLSVIGSTLALFGMFLFRRFMAERSIVYIVGFLTIVGTVLSLPSLAMYHGFHEWTAAHTGGVVDARFIAMIDTALESPLGQVSMIPMLAWIANSAPDRLKATYFAVMASFTNLALSLSNLGTKYLNGIYTVTREVKDQATGAIKVPADYSQLGDLFVAAIVLGLVLPMLAILFVKSTRFKSA
ncbi:MAG: hypothetical protein IPK20_02290 [Betaproteobacteria bacterium]|nr:hypothetical protein [Betaproteobacteria bacterium]